MMRRAGFGPRASCSTSSHLTLLPSSLRLPLSSRSITRTFASGKTEKGIFQALGDLGLPSGKVRRPPRRVGRSRRFVFPLSFDTLAVFFFSRRTTRSNRPISPTPSSTRSRRRSALAPTSRNSSRTCECSLFKIFYRCYTSVAHLFPGAHIELLKHDKCELLRLVGHNQMFLRLLH